MKSMIITCLNCNSKYSVREDALSKKSQLLCSVCNHSWVIDRKLEKNYQENEQRKIEKEEHLMKKSSKFNTIFNIVFSAAAVLAVIANVVIWYKFLLRR
jgi:predicted Zn finger-like uncharacterized protein